MINIIIMTINIQIAIQMNVEEFIIQPMEIVPAIFFKAEKDVQVRTEKLLEYWLDQFSEESCLVLHSLYLLLSVDLSIRNPSSQESKSETKS